MIGMYFNMRTTNFQLLNYSYIWITGGRTMPKMEPTIETEMFNLKSFQRSPGPNLPLPLFGHCLENIDFDTIFLFGGITKNATISYDTYFYKVSTETWYKVKEIYW